MNAGSWVARRRPVSAELSNARRAAGPRFERFAAAMQATPPPDAQVLPEDGPGGVRPVVGPGPAPTHVAAQGPAPAPSAEPIQLGPRPAALAEASSPWTDDISEPMPDASEAATVIPRRPIVEGTGRSRADIPWLGIGSWLLLCGALFVSLVGWPDQAVLDRVTSIWSSDAPSTVSHTPSQGEAAPAGAAPSPADQQDWSAMTPGHAGRPETLPPTELAPPIRSEAPADTPAPADGPPLPRFKPSVDRVAAKFSNAFLEFGDRLQQEGRFEAAVHMRRQGNNLDPLKAAGASKL
jgi:hypothetical protein